MSLENPLNILILCTGNSCRSIMAECILQRQGEGRLQVYSAGSKPQGKVAAHSLTLLNELGYDTSGLRSKSWDEFSQPGSPSIDIVITVCSNAAGETCPIWPGHPLTVHWPFPDPFHFEGTEEEKLAYYRTVYDMLEQRFIDMVNLPLETLDTATLKSQLNRLGAV